MKCSGLLAVEGLLGTQDFQNPHLSYCSPSLGCHKSSKTPSLYILIPNQGPTVSCLTLLHRPGEAVNATPGIIWQPAG